MLAVELLDEAVANGARLFKACEVLDISVRTYYRWKSNKTGDLRKGAAKRVPRKLTEVEKREIINISCSERFADSNPYQIVAILLEEGIYIASVSTFYRVLREYDLVHHRRKGRAGTAKKAPPELVTTGPNQVWSWDITWLKSSIMGMYFYAYVVIDVWSRKIVGWEINVKESDKIASELFKRLASEQNIRGIRLHSDNGNPMKGATMLMTLYKLGVIPSFSRPRVSDDNAYSESLFKTLKYTAGFPKCFSDLSHARAWMADFVNWYNTKHRHSGIGYVTPQQRHSGESNIIMKKRNQTLAKAYALKPERWSLKPAFWNDIKKVYLNPSCKKLKASQCA
ncbi:IS3 family transposase [Spirochaetia bacterium 38H-sp]|uniref:IS3 family transposase n=1 Tax=Rarispira pelagica TaxID=3141764 RepID=A0ABU9UE92_9SPIR